MNTPPITIIRKGAQLISDLFTEEELLSLVSTPLTFLEVAYDYVDSMINLIAAAGIPDFKKQCRRIRQARESWVKADRRCYLASGLNLRYRQVEMIQTDAAGFFNRMYSDYRKEIGLQFPHLTVSKRGIIATAECARSITRVCRSLVRHSDDIIERRIGHRRHSLFPDEAAIIDNTVAEIVKAIAGSQPKLLTAAVHEGSIDYTLTTLDFND